MGGKCLIIGLTILANSLTRAMAQERPYWLTEAPKRETRAVWVTTLGGLDWPKTKARDSGSIEMQKRELTDIFDSLATCNINTILLQVRIRGTVIYSSAYENWDEILTGNYGRLPGYDPLAYAVEQAHLRGMDLHAWVVAIPATYRGKFLKENKSVTGTNPELVKAFNGSGYLDPGEPGTADYLAKICGEIVQNYDVDGVHLDYIRYPDGADRFPDQDTYRRYGGGIDKATWRRKNITKIVSAISQEVRKIKPWVSLSCAVLGRYYDTRRANSRGYNCYETVSQEAKEWLRTGLVDALYPMMYYRGDLFYPFLYDWGEDAGGGQVVVGLATYFLSDAEKGGGWELRDLQAELAASRQAGRSGQAFYRAKFLVEDCKNLRGWLGETVYAYPALPEAKCRENNALMPAIPQGVSRRDLRDGRTELRFEPPAGYDKAVSGPISYNIYASRKWPVDATVAENLVAARLREGRYVYSAYAQEYLCVTAMDAFGNEGPALQCDTPRVQKIWDLNAFYLQNKRGLMAR